MSRKTVSVQELNAQRRRAVQLRVNGCTLASVREQVGLSTPTIVAAVKAFESGGWPAVDVKPRGRPNQKANNGLDENALRQSLLESAFAAYDKNKLWSTVAVREWLSSEHQLEVSTQTAASYLSKWSLSPTNLAKVALPQKDTQRQHWLDTHYKQFCADAKASGKSIVWVGVAAINDGLYLIYAHTLRGRCFWQFCQGQPATADYLRFFDALAETSAKGMALVLPNQHITKDANLCAHIKAQSSLFIAADADYKLTHNSFDSTSHPKKVVTGTHMSNPNPSTRAAANDAAEKKPTSIPNKPASNDSVSSAINSDTLTHLQRLEAESIHIMREVVAEANNPVMMYSIGKDSAVMLHLARKAFYPAPLPFPLLHVDTRWKFQAMYDFRDTIANEQGIELITHTNPEGIEKDVNPFTHGSALHTDIMKTEALKQALDKHGFDVAFGGARRDEEKSRSKERVFSFRTNQHRWEPKSQRPELWNLYNGRKQNGESIRAFPLSNWTELDIWQYIHQQNIPIVPLYFAGKRPVVERDGMLIMVDDDRMPLREGEVPMMRNVRFRTLGCYPLTAAVDSEANTLSEIIQEMLLTKTSERQGRMIDHDSAASMEKKKQEGYF